MSVIFNNYTVQDIFDNMSPWLADGVSKANQLPQGVWKQKRDEFLTRNRSIIEGTTGAGLPLHDMANYYTGIFNSSAVENVGASYSAWEKIKGITDKNIGSGTIYGWDTETFGDITTAGSIAKGAGVTELGINRSVYRNGMLTSADHYSILIKMNDSQKDYVESVMKKLREGKDWTALTEAERVTLNRISMYRTALDGKAIIDYMGNANVITVSNLSPAMGRDLHAVEKGLNFLTSHGTDLDTILPRYMEVLRSGAQDGIALTGANTSQFDRKVLMALGVSNDDLLLIDKSTADITMGQRVIASSQNISTFQLNEQVKGEQLVRHTVDSNTVSAMNEALGYQEFDAHEAGADSFVTSRIAASQDYQDGKGFAQSVMEAHEKQLKQMQEIKSGIVLVNNGYLDKNTMDQVRIGNETTHSYSISGSYWRFNEEHSGRRMFTPEGKSIAEEVFIASFKSAATGEEDIEFTKMFANEEEFSKWMAYNTTLLGEDEVSPKQIDNQARYHSLDFGRREYDRFFEVNSPARAGDADEGGYASLVKYLDAYDKVDAELTKRGIKDKTAYIQTRDGFDTIRPILAENNLKYNTQQRSFVGMYGKLQDESEVLRYIANYAGEHGINNITRTSVVHEMHKALLSKMSQNIADTTGTLPHEYTLSDVYSIELKGADGNYHTISGNTTNKLASSIRYLYENKSKKSIASSLSDMRAGIDDLFERGLLDEDIYKQLSNELQSGPSLYNASQDVANALDGIFKPFRSHSAIDIYSQVMDGTNTEIDEVIQQRIIAKNVDGPISVKVQRMYGTRAVTFNGETITANDYFKHSGVQAHLDSVGQSAIRQVTFASNLTLEPNDEVLETLAERLGYSENQKRVVSKMFNATQKKNGKVQPASYALNTYKDNGLVSALVTPNNAGNSGYIVITNSKHANQAYNLLSNMGDTDLAYDEMVDMLKGHASVFELKAIHKKHVGDIPEALQGLYGTDEAIATYVDQGRSTIRYIHPSLNLYVTDGIVHGGLTEAGTEVLRAFSLSGNNAFGAVFENDFDEANRIFKRAIDKAITGQSGSASNQGIVNDIGERVRGMNFNLSDVNHGNLFEYGAGLGIAQQQVAHMNTSLDNPFIKLMYAFNEGLPDKIVTREQFYEKPIMAYEMITNSPGWKEFAKRHFHEPIINNEVIQNFLKTDATFDAQGNFKKTLVDLIIDTAATDTTGKYFSQYSIESLRAFQKAAPYLSLNLGETHVLAGYASAIDPSSYFATAPGAGINRPTAYQRLHPRNFNPELLPADYMNRTGSVAGTVTTTPNAQRWAELDDIIMPDGTRHADQISAITTTYKQLSDAQLQERYTTVKRSLSRYAKDTGMDVNLLKEAFDAQVKAAPSIYGDSLIISSSLATAFNEMAVDTKKLKFDRIARIEDDGDLQYTTAKLTSLKGKVVKRGDVIGHDSRGAITWEGLETVLTEKNVQDILTTGETVITPTNSISSRKFMINESEKAIANGVIVNEEFLKAHNFQSKEQAHEYLDFVFEKVLGVKKGTTEYIPTIGGEMSVAKHISGTHLSTPLNLIIHEYKKAGMLNVLENDIQKYYPQWSPKALNGMMSFDTQDSHFTSDVLNLIEDIKTNHVGVPSINRKIGKLLNKFESQNMGFLTVQSNVQNQIMGEALYMDPRIEAAIRRRHLKDVANGTVDGINGKSYEDILMDDLYESVRSGKEDYVKAADLGDRHDVFNQVVERNAKQRNAALVKQRRKVKQQEKVVTGIAESVKFFNNPQMDLKNRNIVSIGMDQIIEKVPVPSRENLSHFIFRRNGEYSQEFLRMAKEQGVNLNAGSFSVAVDFGREFTIGHGENAVKMSKMLIPIYDIYSDFEDAITKEEDILFVKSQKDIMNFFEVYKNNINTISDESDKNIADAIARVRIGLQQELATDDKTSLLFKTFGKYRLPNSAYLLAQDEIAPVTKEMLGISRDIERIREAIRTGSYDNSALQELSEAYKIRSQKLGEIADDIINTGNLELHGNTLMGYKGYTRAANGGFLNVNAVNRNTFEQRLGFDIGLFGKSLFEDIKYGRDEHYMSIGTRTFTLDVAKAETRIVQSLNKLDHFEYTGNLKTDIQKYMITIKDLNADLLNRKGGKAQYDEILVNAENAVKQAFDFIGEDYLKTVGITTHLTVRHPAFGTGIGPANLILDDSVGDGQSRELGPVYAKTMNEDHDGDIKGLAIDNAGNAMKKTRRQHAVMELIEKQAKDNFDIVVKMIRDGDAFSYDNISDAAHLESIVLRTYDKQAYLKAQSEFLQSIGIDKSTMLEYDADAIEFITAHSSQMKKATMAYNQAHGNFLKSNIARIAALKAKTNKENIGIISNAAFALHDAITTASSRTTNNVTKQKLADLHWRLDFISEKGMDGLMSIAEQKGIDTKHVLNATRITDINLFSKGMKGLMNTNEWARNRNLQNSMANIIQSIEHTLWDQDKFNKKSRTEILKIADEILHTSVADYTKLIDEATDKLTVLDLATKQQLRVLYDLSTFDEIRKVYNSPFRKFRQHDPDAIRKALDSINEYTSGKNVASKASKAFNASSDIKLALESDTLYVASGGLTRSDRGYILSPYKDDVLKLNKNGTVTLRLKEVGLTESLPATGRYKYFAGDSVQEIMDQVNNFFIKDTDGKFVTIATRDFKDGVNDTILSQFGANRKRARAYNVLNDFFVSGIDTNIEQYFAMGGNRRDPLNSKSILKLRDGVGDEYFDLINRFAQTTQEDLWEIDRLHAFMGTKNADIKGMSYEGLIKAVNADIVNNPQNYANSTEFASYLDVVESKLSSIVGTDNYAKYRQEYRIIGDFDSKAYNQIIDGLRSNVYDIMSERQSLTEGIDSLKQYKKLSIDEINDVLKSRNQTIEGIIGDLTQQQTRTIQSAEAGIHALFSSTKQIDTFFDWSQLSRHSKVGFGEFIGYEFGALSQADIDKIFKYADENVARYTAENNTISVHAYEQTMKLLKQWTSAHAPAKKSAMSYRVSAATTDALSEIAQLKTMGSLKQMMEDTAEAMSQAEETVKKKTLTDIGATKAKDIFDKLPKKAIGIGVATMAAIGIVNNALHNQKNQSPLAPTRRPGGNTLPNYNSPATSSMPVKAPLSRQKTVYHDRGSGFNFKVSANTRNRIDDQNNAKLIGMSGGGNPSIYSQSDMSRVTNNWLANKFADLA